MTESETIKIPTTLATTVAAVAAEAEAATTARAERVAAEADLLDCLVKLVRPCLRAVGTRPRTYSIVRKLATSEQTEAERRASWRGVLVHGPASAEEDHPRFNEGAYEGQSLWLAEDGTWITLTYHGAWSRWQGSSSRWESAEEVLDSARVVDTVHIALIVEALVTAIEGAKGKRATTTQRSLQAAARARAILALLA